jgi:hypothetical protein
LSDVLDKKQVGGFDTKMGRVISRGQLNTAMARICSSSDVRLNYGNVEKNYGNLARID